MYFHLVGSAAEIINPPSNQSLIAGDSAHFLCSAVGAPSPTITWSRLTTSGNVEILSDDNSRINLMQGGSELLIPVTTVADSGRYMCNVTNLRGNDTAQAWLQVSGKK